MGSYGSWSVKGIDDRARAVAKEKARQEGVTLGDYINSLLLHGHSEAGPRDGAPQERAPNAYREPGAYRDHSPRETRYQERAHASYAPPAEPTSLDGLTRRIEAVEARSTLAITGIDQTVLGLLARLENTEHASSAMAAEVDSLIDELRETHEALQAKVESLESDDSPRQNLDALKALEQALGKLATHVYEESELAQEEASAIKGRMETGFADLNDRVDGMELKVESTLSKAAARVEKAVEQSELRAEGTSRHLSERFTAMESGLASRFAKVDAMTGRMDAVEQDVSGALSSMESTLMRVQDRLNRAETTTDTALKALEQTFASLDDRIDAVALHANPERAAAMREELETRFEALADDLRRSIDQTRAQMVREIETATAGATPDSLQQVEASLDDIRSRMAEGEERAHAAVADVSAQVTRMATGLDKRLNQVEQRDDTAFEHMSEQIHALADRLEARVSESEKRSAGAIEQVGSQVATAIKRVQARQQESAKQLDDKLAAVGDRQDTRLSQALANISERLAGVQEQTVAVMSPVQKAMASLAARLEALEDFNAPPHAPTPQATTATDSDEAEPGFDPEIMPTEPAPSGNADDEFEDFVAGLPELQDAAPAEVDFPEPAETSPVMDAESGTLTRDDVITADDDIGAADDDYTTFASDQDADAEPEAIDPIASLEADLAPWDDGRDEARDSDIFHDDELGPDDHIFSAEPAGDALTGAETADAGGTDDEDKLAELLGEGVNELEIDEDATNYLARARKAAIAAAGTTEANGPARARAALKRSPKPNATAGAPVRSSKVPVIAAASVLALATAGVAGYVTLRGKQDPQIAAFTVEPATGPTSEASVAEPSLAGVDYAEDEAALNEELFEEEGSVDPAAAVITATPTPTPTPALPRIPARTTLQDAAIAGDPVAQFQWGEQRLAANDYAQGSDYVRRAAEQGLAAAQYRLAKLHEKGLGVPRDLNLSRQWTDRAAKAGNVKAMHDLAVFYADGESGPQSYAAAAEWFRKAADFGLVDSQYNLGVLYENGLGISPSQAEALYWYEIAARNGDASAPGNINALRDALPLETAQAASRRAAAWEAANAATPANGQFGPRAWNNGHREQVLALQTVLNGLGYDAGTPDGLAGSGTRAAIRKFQGDAGLPVDGEISDDLVAALNERAQGA